MGKRAWRRIAVWSMAGALALVLLAVFYYRVIQRPHWEDQSLAVDRAVYGTPLELVTKVERFHGEQPYIIVWGKDRRQQPLLVWVGMGEDHGANPPDFAYADEGVSAGEVVRLVRNRRPGAEIIRIVPGKLGGDLVWEAFYYVPESRGKRHYYDYFRFSDGELLESYTLPLHR